MDMTTFDKTCQRLIRERERKLSILEAFITKHHQEKPLMAWELYDWITTEIEEFQTLHKSTYESYLWQLYYEERIHSNGQGGIHPGPDPRKGGV